MKNNSLMVKNAIFLAIRTILITIVGLYSVSELLNILGVKEYGLFNLVFGVAMLFSFINGAMITSTQRYLSYALGKEDSEMLNSVWQNSIYIYMAIAFFTVILLFSIRDIILLEFLVIDSNLIDSSYYIYYCSIAVVFFLILQAPFNSLILAYERMSVFAFLSLFDSILKLFIIYLLYYFNNDFLKTYSIMYLGVVFFVFLLYCFYCFNFLNKKFSFARFDSKIIRELTSYSYWNIFGNFSFLLKVQGLNFILNIFVGILANSAYAIANNVNSALNNLVNSIVTAINPQIYKSYAEGNFSRNIKLISLSSRFSFFFGLLCICPIFYNAEYLLKIWLNEIPLYLVHFIKITLIILLIDCFSGSLMTGIQATGNIKSYQVIVSLAILLNLPISYILVKLYGDPILIYWVALGISILSFILRLYFIQKLTKFIIKDYLKDVIFRCFLVVAFSFALLWIIFSQLVINNDFLGFLINSSLIALVVILNIMIFGLQSEERKILFSKISGYLK